MKKIFMISREYPPSTSGASIAIDNYIKPVIKMKIKTNKLKRIVRFVRSEFLKRGIPSVHTETIHDKWVWKGIKKYSSKHKAIWFVFTPENIDYVKAQAGFKGTKKDYEKIILERYKWLQRHGQEIQLHIHLTMYPELISKTEKEKTIKKAYNWLVSNGFNPTKIVFGWWIYDDDMVNISERLGLKVVGYYDYKHLHDYDLAERQLHVW